MIVTSALRKAASVRSLSPTVHSKMWLWCLRGPCAPVVLPARSSRSTGASASIALNGSISDRQRLVFDHHLVDAVVSRVAVGRDHKGDLLVLEQHLAVGQHHLHVAGERRHPGEIDRLQRLGGDDREHARHFQRLGVVDLLDARVRMRRADEIAVQHTRQLQVVDIVAPALREADVFDPLALAAHAFEFGFTLFPRGSHVVHSAASLNSTPLILSAAY